MPAKTSVGRDFQDTLLGRLMDGNQVTTVYLRNRMSIRGRIIKFDPFVLLIDPLEGGPLQMVYKSAVVSISGPRPPMRRPGFGGPGGPPRGPRPGGPRPPYPSRPGEQQRTWLPPQGRPQDGNSAPPEGEA
ncbi:MAG TPA: RNA chaperone Hfq [Armatimonadota bacterium]|nr:RNA chaperone Hfq [Armatimonadota bacterium]